MRLRTHVKHTPLFLLSLGQEYGSSVILRLLDSIRSPARFDMVTLGCVPYRADLFNMDSNVVAWFRELDVFHCCVKFDELVIGTTLAMYSLGHLSILAYAYIFCSTIAAYVSEVRDP